ncbi:DNA-binding response OmpR family regulator [Catenulispora sp. EB89]|uniref:two-component system response regulator CseB n=1 Tax=Catenulispora sp. EB89 TaxID=3156257 RepID=UPI003517AF2C
MTSLLLVEDDEVIRIAVGRTLERYGFAVTTAADGLAGLERFREAVPDLLLLDVMLPGLDGIGLCRRVRESSQVPILMMSARGDSLDVVGGLEAGADDYVVKPVDTSVLVARIRAVMRRSTVDMDVPGTPGASADHPSELVFGDIRIDPHGMEVSRAGEPVALTPTELRLLLELAAHPGVVLERHRLLRDVWDYKWQGGDSRVVDLCVARLRTKIGAERIETVRGFGYKLRR